MLSYRIIDDDITLHSPVPPLLSKLPRWRREQALRYKFERGQRECALSYLLLADMIGHQPEFTLGEHGKPYIDGVCFSLSHCNAAIACAVSSGEVGIDVECLGRYKPSLAKYCMNEEELQSILSSDSPDIAFTLLWTKKEALLKLTGEGITDNMKLCLTPPRTDGVKFTSGVNVERGYAWSIASLETNSSIDALQAKRRRAPSEEISS